MRILALTNLYPSPIQPHRAPFNRHQFRILAEQHQLQVIAPILWMDEMHIARTTGQRIPVGRRVTTDGIVVDHPRYWYTPRLLRGGYGRFYTESVRGTFRRAVAEFSPDIVFAPWAYPDGWAAVRLGHARGLPVVVQVHGSDVRQAGQVSGRVGGTRQALTNADGVVAVSQDLRNRVLELGAHPADVRVVVDGVDRQRFHPGDRQAAQMRLGLAPHTRHLLFVGNLLPVKGVDVLLEACVRLHREIGPWQLHLIGDGSSRRTLAALAATLGLTERVRFHGSVDHVQLPEWFQAADLFVLPSRSEGIPNVLLEASACATPYVASDVGGIAEIAGMGASRLVPPEDPASLARAMEDCLRQAPAQPACGPRDRHAAAADVAGFLQEILSRHRASGLALSPRAAR